MLPFSFQKGNKATGCEDATPLANTYYSIVCDGLGGAGSTKHKISEDGTSTMRTSGYIGSRVVSKSVEEFYSDNYSRMAFATLQRKTRPEELHFVITELKNKIESDLIKQMKVLEIDPMLTRNKTLKIFPTTLASSLYFEDGNKVIVLAIWAGDSRIYILSPTKGLQLLSLDDAINADIEMKSASEMTNCISAGNSFRLNYSIIELEEPCCIFSCSDGCFDYIHSPLHFEWLLLQTILSYIPDTEGNDFGQIFANSVRDTVYKSIGDDTTMAGILYQIDSIKHLKYLYAERMEQFGQLAVQMNNALKEQKNIQNEKDSAAKKCRLYENKVLVELKSTITDVLMKKTPAILYGFLETLPCFEDYREIINAINQKVDEECVAALQELNSILNETKKVCEEMIVSDYLKWNRLNPEQPVAGTMGMDFFVPKSRGGSKKNLNYLKPMSLIQPLNACVELLNHPDFRRVSSYASIQNIDFEKIIRTQINEIETLISIMDNDNSLFEDMWAQAYFSTTRFEKERQDIKKSRDFAEIVEEALENPMTCRYISELTFQKINEYKNMRNKMFSIQQKYKNERDIRLKTAPERFYVCHENEIVEYIFQQNMILLNSIFVGTNISIERLIAYIEARNIIAGIEQKISEAQQKVAGIWDKYKPNYQLFNLVTEKGIV